jgi:hypothetical protein
MRPIDLSDERALNPTERPLRKSASAPRARTAFPRNVLRAIRRVFQPYGRRRQDILNLLFEVQEFPRRPQASLGGPKPP